VESPVRGQLARRVRRRGPGKRAVREGGTAPRLDPTSTCWKPQGSPAGSRNARHVKNVPGRPKTDKLDAVWLAKVVERGMCRPSFVPPAPIRTVA